jgi:quinolinate synthase
MKKNTLEKLVAVLENETNLVTVDEKTAAQARLSIQKMLELS